MKSGDRFDGCREASLEQVLARREERVALVKDMCVRGGSPAVSVKLNIPGPVKTYPLAVRALGEALGAVLRQAVRMKWPVLSTNDLAGDTGCESVLCVCAAAGALKQSMMEIEDRHPLGRLFDLDVFGADASPLSGRDYGRPERTCIVCGGPVWACARSRKHPASELAERTAELIDRYFRGRDAEIIAERAVKSLLFEVSVTPKPGLVDRANNGAHSDMDFFSFLSSASALGGYFRFCARAGIDFEGTPDGLLEQLRYAGKEAESAMEEATGGANTHRGAIFSLGILCAAAGYLGEGLTADGLLGTAAAIASKAARGQSLVSHGESVWREHRIPGILGEAAAGFPSARAGYMKLLELTGQELPLEEACVVTLLHILSELDDTNIVHRAGRQRLLETRREVRHLLEAANSPKQLIRAAQELDARFIRDNISPGGAADMLGLSLFLYFICAKDGHGEHKDLPANH